MLLDMRTADPDPEFQWYQTYVTRNYVKYQPMTNPLHPESPPSNFSYQRPSEPYAAMVVATGINSFSNYMSYGCVSPRAYATHNNLPYNLPSSEVIQNLAWTRYGGADVQPTPAYASRMRKLDDSIGLIFRHAQINPGETIQMSYFINLNDASTDQAFQALTQVIILQPSNLMSGGEAYFIVKADDSVDATACEFLIFATNRTTSSLGPRWYSLGQRPRSAPHGSNTFVLRVNTTAFLDDVVHLKAIVHSSAGLLEADKAASISNVAPLMCFQQRDRNGTYVFYSNVITELTVAYCDQSPHVASGVNFYLELYTEEKELVSTLLESKAVEPWTVSVSLPPLQQNNTSVFIKAVTAWNEGYNFTTTVFAGIAIRVDLPPSMITLSATSVKDRSPPGIKVGYFNTTDPDSSDKIFSYTLIDSAANQFIIERNTLVVARTIDYRAQPYPWYLLRVRSCDPWGLCLDVDFNITIESVNSAPTGVVESYFRIPENATVGLTFGKLVAVDADVEDTHTYLLLRPSAVIDVNFSTGSLSLVGALDYDYASQYTLWIRVTDSGAPPKSIELPVFVNISDLPPRDVLLSCNPCSIDDSMSVGSALGYLVVIDAVASIVQHRYTYSVLVSGADPDLFEVSAAGMITLKTKVIHHLFPYHVSLTVTATNAGGLSVTRDFVITVANRLIPTVSNVTCYCDDDRSVGATVASKSSSGLCRVPAESHDGSPLSFGIVAEEKWSSSSQLPSVDNTTFSIQDCTGVLLVNQTLDARAAELYLLKVLVQSNEGGVYAYVTLHVVRTYKPPEFLPSEHYLPERAPVGAVVVSNLTAFVRVNVPDMLCDYSFRIVGGNSLGLFVMRNQSIGEVVVARPGIRYRSTSSNEFPLTVRISDGQGLFSDATVMIIITRVIVAPLLRSVAGAFAYVHERAPEGTLVGSSIVPSDADDSLQYDWNIVSGDNSSQWGLVSKFDDIVGCNVTYLSVNKPDISFNVRSSYLLLIEVSVHLMPWLRSRALYLISVVPVYLPPLVPQSISFNILENETAGSFIGSPLINYVTDQNNGRSLYSFAFESTITTMFDLNPQSGQLVLGSGERLNYMLTRYYICQVKVVDQFGLSASTTVQVSVIPVLEPPAFAISGTLSAHILETKFGEDPNYVVSEGQPLHFTATDNHDSQISFRVVSVDGRSNCSWMFYVLPSSNTSAYLVGSKETSFNHKVKSVFVVSLEASNALHSSVQDFEVFVYDSNSPPVVRNSPVHCYIALDTPDGSECCIIAGSDPDSVDEPHGWGRLTYSFVASSGGNAVVSAFSIATRFNMGVVTLSSASSLQLERADNLSLNFVVQVVDGGGLFTTCNVTIFVIGSRGVLPSCPPQTLTANVSENAAVGSLVLSLPPFHGLELDVAITAGNDDGDFVLDNVGGLLLVSKPLSFSRNHLYDILVQFTTKQPFYAAVTCLVKVLILEVATPPTFPPQTVYVDEHIPSGYLTTGTSRSSPLYVISLSAVGSASGYFSISCGNCTEDPFIVDRYTGQLLLNKGFTLNYALKRTYYYSCAWTSSLFVVESTLTIIVLDVPEPPYVKPTYFVVAEGTAGTMGYVLAYDADFSLAVNFSTQSCQDDCGLKYVIMNSSCGPFSIDRDSGLMAVNDKSLDFEDVSQYVLIIKVTDATGYVATGSVYVTVTDVPDCSISSVTDLRGNLLKNVSTVGGTDVFIRGRNFGPTSRRLISSGMNSSNVIISAHLQDDGSPTMYLFSMSCAIYDIVEYENTLLRCVAPPGIGADLGSVVTIQANYFDGMNHVCSTSLSGYRLSYASPSLKSVNTNFSGPSYQVALTGDHFGSSLLKGNLITVRYWNLFVSRTVACAITTTNVKVVCVVGSGVGGRLNWQITVGGQISNSVISPAYSPPIIATVTCNSSLSTAGGTVFFVHGSNFGDDASLIAVTYGSSYEAYEAKCSLIQIQRVLICTSIAGTGYKLWFEVTAGDQRSGIFYSNVSYDVPLVSSLSGPAAGAGSTKGGDLIIIVGKHFGPVTTKSAALNVSYGHWGFEYSAKGCVVTIANSEIRCFTSEGTGGNHSWHVWIAGQLSMPSLTKTSYGSPVITAITGPGAVAAASGGSTVTLSGLNFGSSMAKISYVGYEEVRYRKAYDVTKNCVMSIPHSALLCVVLPGAGADLVWSITVDSLSSSGPRSSYAGPEISNVFLPDSPNSVLLVSGGQRVVIAGNNFGPPANCTVSSPCSYLETVSYGPSGTEYLAKNCTVRSPTLISCVTAPGVGASLRWVVTVEGQRSAAWLSALAYEPPQIFSFYPASLSTAGTDVVTLTGSGFSKDYPPLLLLNGVAWEYMWSMSNPYQVKFQPPETVSLKASSLIMVSIAVGGQSGSKTLPYTPPSITSVHSFPTGNINGSSDVIKLVILGSSFTMQPSVYCTVDNGVKHSLPCSSLSQYEISCLTILKFGNVTVTAGQLSSNQKSFRYGDPSLLSSAMLVGRARTEGYSASRPAVLRIVGQYFGGSSVGFVVFVVNKAGVQSVCPLLSYESIPKTDFNGWITAASSASQLQGIDSQQNIDVVTCALPRGAGKRNSIIVRRESVSSIGCSDVTNISPAPACLSYDPPTVANLLPSTAPTDGGSVVIVHGDNFGSFCSVTVGSVPWRLLSAMSNDTTLTLMVPPGQGKSLLLNIQVEGQTSAASTPAWFSYAPPRIEANKSTVVVLKSQSEEFLQFNVSGDNFGVIPPRAMLSNGVKLVVKQFNSHFLSLLMPLSDHSTVLSDALVLSVNVSGQLATERIQVACDPPYIFSMTPTSCGASGGRQSNTKVTIRGVNFGVGLGNFALYVGLKRVSKTDILFLNDSLLVFFPPAGIGAGLPVKLIVNSRSSVGIVPIFAYDRPLIRSVAVAGEASTAGGSLLIIRGQSFGDFGATVTLTDPLFRDSPSTYYRMCNVPCRIQTLNDTDIVCLLPAGAGTGLILNVTVGGQSNTNMFSYAPPFITSIYQSRGGDASGGEVLKVYGNNFGSWRTNVSIYIGSEPCLDPVWMNDDAANKYAAYLSCVTPPVPVGRWPLVVFAAWQFSEPYQRYNVECKRGYYGLVGEMCVSCGGLSSGLICDEDNLGRPTSAPGFYAVHDPPSTSSADWSVTQWKDILPCEPAGSCLGNNTCAAQYTGERCASCVSGYFLLDGICQSCWTLPSIIGLMLAAFIGALLALALYAYMLSKNVQMCTAGIAIDFLQCVGLLSSLRNALWSPILSSSFHILSMLDLNINMFAWNCIGGGGVLLPYQMQWLVMMALPLCSMLCLFVLVVSFRLSQSRLYSLPVSVADAVVLATYFVAPLLKALYLPMLYLSMSVFDCRPTTPHDGHTYMASFGIQGGACYAHGSIQQQLQPWALAVIIIYGLGLPILIACATMLRRSSYLSRRNSSLIASDTWVKEQSSPSVLWRTLQCFRAESSGPIPDWNLIIMLRKICLCLTVVFFQSNVQFLLTLWLLIILVSLALQLVVAPYLPGVGVQYDEIVKHISQTKRTDTKKALGSNSSDLDTNSRSSFVATGKRSRTRIFVEYLLSTKYLRVLSQPNALEASLLSYTFLILFGKF